MIRFCQYPTLAVVASVFLLCLTGSALAQGSNSNPWPTNPPVGIGTQLSGPFTPQNALHIHHDPTHSATLPAILRLSDGLTDTSAYFGALALMPDTNTTFYQKWSNLATLYGLVLHEQLGDLILANYNEWGGAIRMSTTPDPSKIPSGTPANDLERMTIMPNGNVGIDLPPKANGLDSAADQFQIGGGYIAPTGYTSPIPGLSIYGGNRFEGMLRPGPDTGTIPVDWRGIAFNHYEDHYSGYSARFAPMAWSGIGFAPDNGGLVNIGCVPWHTGDSLNDNTGGVTLQINGQQGLSMYSYESASDPYHHYIDVWRPGFGTNRNVNGLIYLATPVYIGSGAPDFTNLAHVHPGIGDDSTWWLAVNGPALFKEAYVNENDWPDYVFLQSYHLMSIEDFGNYIERNHHLPDMPSADSLASGVPLGKTEADLTKQVEELSLYIVQLNKQVTALKVEVEGLKNGNER